MIVFSKLEATTDEMEAKWADLGHAATPRLLAVRNP